MKSYTKVVFVDNKDIRSLPKNISKAISGAGSVTPRLVFLSPDGETNFGGFDHKKLKGQDYSKIFKDVKKKIRDAKKEGALSEAVVSEKADTELTDGAEEEETDGVIITSPRLRTWKSAKGKEIKAKLIKFEYGEYHLKTSKGRDIKVKPNDLDEESVKMAEEIVEINSK